jgi:branched-chain amino acid transport system substrate-binding protein
MENINIGLLLPSSTIFPIGKDFEKGLKEGLKHNPDINLEVEITKEFIGQGDVKLTENACNKFFNYDEVDLVTGVVSNLAVNSLSDRFKGQQKPLLINNLGGHVPNISQLNEYVFINSAHLWQQAYTLGYFGVKEFGKKGMFIGSVYDAGYSFSHLFYEGMRAADAQSEWSFSVPPMPSPGELSNMDVIFPFLEQYQPDFIFAAFCGAETTLFLNEFINRGWHHKTKVLGLPYLLAPFAPLNDDITIYTTTAFEDAPEVDPAKAFYYLGQQAGETIAKAAVAATNAKGLKDEIDKLNTMFNVSQQVDSSSGAKPHTTILKNDIRAGENTFTTRKLIQCDTFGLDAEKIKLLTQSVSAGWNNPYLCI